MPRAAQVFPAADGRNGVHVSLVLSGKRSYYGILKRTDPPKPAIVQPTAHRLSSTSMRKSNDLSSVQSDLDSAIAFFHKAAHTTVRAATLIVALCLLQQVWAAPLSLQSDSFTLTVDRTTGRIVDVVNRLTGRTDRVHDEGALLVFDDFEIDLGKTPFTLVSSGPDEVRYRAESNGIELQMTYRLKADHAWADRELALTNRRSAPALLKRVQDARLRFAQSFESVVYHDDNLTSDVGGYGNREADGTYRTALNVFLREPRGGLIAGLKYPYWTPWMTLDSLDIFYEPNYRLKPGERLELPAFFIGAYEKTGYTCRKELHWRPRLISLDENAMDWGEVHAMQQVLKDYLPLYPTPAPGYFLWLNEWWAVLETPEEKAMQGPITPAVVPAWFRLIDQVKMSGVVDALNTAPVWVGLAEYAFGPDTLSKVGADARFPMTASIRAVLDHAKAAGLPMLSFADPNGRLYRADRPDWSMQPTFDPAVRWRMKCPANDAYEEWFDRLNRSAIDTAGLSGWAWDYHWMRRPALCFDPTHGHAPGNIEFQQYRDITRIVQGLREHYPHLFLEIYWGLKEGGSWAHRGLNSLENIYENGNVAPPGMTRADDERFQTWFNQNYRFLPTYMNLAQINFEKNEPNGFTYSMLSALQASHHGQLNEWPKFEDRAGAERVFADLKYWKQWAGEHLEFLNDRVTLFGMPCRKDGIDGSAHMRGDRGYIFVFNPWPGEAKWGSIPLNAMLGLERGGRFAIDEISTKTPQRMAVAQRGDTFVFRIPAKTALLFEVRPTGEPVRLPQAPADAKIQPAFVK